MIYSYSWRSAYGNLVRNRTILCSAGSHENLDTKSSPICRVAINVPPCLVATKQSTANCQNVSFLTTSIVGRVSLPAEDTRPTCRLAYYYDSRPFRSVEHSLLGTFAPMELTFLGSERSKNFRSYETLVPWELIFQELSLQMS